MSAGSLDISTLNKGPRKPQAAAYIEAVPAPPNFSYPGNLSSSSKPQKCPKQNDLLLFLKSHLLPPVAKTLISKRCSRKISKCLFPVPEGERQKTCQSPPGLKVRTITFHDDIDFPGPKAVIGSLHKAFSDFKFYPLKSIAEDDGGENIVVTRSEFTGFFLLRNGSNCRYSHR